ncbi:hypothetical protein L9F63_009453 [Diploptera punctata]|uniref:Uncharacterized protein n=1 Tax=Diploptera punctata TaxID=6984 RepID=A0AAD8AJM1_DIPPU|nr:hypothetical protein L9F63_009453 [Diploptera punctata]
MSDLFFRRADLAGNEIFIKYYGTEELQFSLPAMHYQEIVVLVPKSGKLHAWFAMFKDFDFVHYIHDVFIFFCSVVVWNILRKFHFTVNDKSYHEQNLSSSFLVMLQIFMAMPMRYLTQVRVSSQRVLLSSCLICSWFLAYIFQGLLLDVISNPLYSPNIDTLQQLNASGISIFTSNPSLMDIFNNSPKFDAISKKLTLNSKIGNIIRYMIKNRNVSFVTARRKAKWIIKFFRGSTTLHIMQESPASYLMSYMIHKSSPYAPRLRLMLGRIEQAGLVEHWDEDSEYSMNLKRRNTIEDDLNGISSLNISEVSIAFYILLVGLSLSAVILISEFCVRKIRIQGFHYRKGKKKYAKISQNMNRK